MKTIEDIPEFDLPKQAGGIDLAGILRMLFKHKWKLIFCTLVGLGAAAAMYLTHTPYYESTSKIFVRYVEEISNVDPNGGAARRTPNIESVINAEVEILRSWDLAKAVVEEVTPMAIAGNSPEATPQSAVQRFVSGLEVAAGRGTRVISVTYRHPDPDVTVRALSTLVKLYQDKHVEIHRATKSRETSRSRRAALTAKVAEMTDAIEKIKATNGLSSLPEAAAGLNRRSDETHAELNRAEVDFEEQKARVGEMQRMGLVSASKPDAAPTATAATPTPASSTPDHHAHLEYQGVVRQLTTLQDTEMNLLRTYSRDSTEVRENRKRMAELETQRAKLEATHPSMFAVAPRVTSGAPVPPTLDPLIETVRLATLKARVEFLQKRQLALKEEFKNFALISKQIHELERERDIQTEGLRQFAGDFQRTEFEAPLSSSQYDNIVVVQTSSPPVLALSTLKKILGGLGFGGFAFGVGLITVLEFGFNRSIARPLELETRAGIPLMLNIPHVGRSQRRALRARKPGKGELAITSEFEAWTQGHFIRPYAEALRDRLVLHFEQIGLTRKPKLVGVAGHSRGAGVSTIASGIAAALSQVGDGKVLLVDMNLDHAAVHPFFEGKPAASLTAALEAGGKMESAAENLYLATAATTNGGTGQLFPKRFYDLMPEFQASQFDYIIFDMPPMDESSLTLAMSGFMDKVLLVVEADKDNRDVIKRASGELLRARAKLSGVLNKSRTYGPKWLQEA